ncbi:hypothetical protein PIB30_107162 [Stylosanthes scabra]|uniref:Uncharacterized protein n=1 Tax=Stylosanthes scabra TaxID=79078 RepID=A0ABU6ZXU0_9FABA|nr:hypothetical protein [Stylosanthes scabra]
MKICDDEDIVEHYYPKNESVDTIPEPNPTETSGNNDVDFSAAVVNLQNDSDTQLTVVSREQVNGTHIFHIMFFLINHGLIINKLLCVFSTDLTLHDSDPLERFVNSTKAKTAARIGVHGEEVSIRGKKIAVDKGQLSTNKFSKKMPKRSKLQISDGDD